MKLAHPPNPEKPVYAFTGCRIARGLLVALVFWPGTVTRAQEPPAPFFPDSNCAILARRARPLPDTSKAWNDVRMCFFRDDMRRRAYMKDFVVADFARMGEETTEIPETGDEQRLRGDATTLGPVAGIYFSPFMPGFRQRWQLAAHVSATSKGVLAAFVVVVREPGPPTPIPQYYRELFLDYGKNCIFLEPLASGYQAWVVTVPTRTPCRTVGVAPRGPLPVVVTPTGFAQTDNAPSARFADDPDGRPALGFPCLRDWCEVSASGAYRTPMVFGYTRELRIKGWHDEQYLGMQSGSSWVPTPLRAAIVPIPGAEDYDDVAFTNVFRYVADVFLDQNPPAGKYWDRGFRRGRNTIELRNDVAGGKGWQFRITARDGAEAGYTPKLLRGMAMPHMDVPVPGTPRFRWAGLDDDMWVPCGNQCCTSDGSIQ